MLYTGDLRAERNFCQGPDFDLLVGKQIDHLYLDTTFCKEEYDEFVSKDKSVQLMLSLIDDQPKDEQIYLDHWCYGFEELWCAIYERYGSQVMGIAI